MTKLKNYDGNTLRPDYNWKTINTSNHVAQCYGGGFNNLKQGSANRYNVNDK